jgi:hypothetical protein
MKVKLETYSSLPLMVIVQALYIGLYIVWVFSVTNLHCVEDRSDCVENYLKLIKSQSLSCNKVLKIILIFRKHISVLNGFKIFTVASFRNLNFIKISSDK